MKVTDLGSMPYAQALAAQEDAHAQALEAGYESLLLVEHPPVITLGRRAELGRACLKVSPDVLAHRHVEVVETDRGGLATFHGPGQIVAYPILCLANHGLSVGSYMRALQHAVIDTLAVFGIKGQSVEDDVGVWVHCGHHGDLAKICAFGTRIRKGVSLHGLALNVEPDLSYFDLIDACGLGRPVTSMHRLLHDSAPSTSAVKPILTSKLLDRLMVNAQ